MNIYQLTKDKVYVSENREYKLTHGFLMTRYPNGWSFAQNSYNEVLDMHFEEVVRIPDENTPVNTKVRVTDYENDGWIYPRYFANYLPNASYKFWVFNDGENQEDAEKITGWKYCEIIEESEVAE